jgi:hypothetical protein
MRGFRRSLTAFLKRAVIGLLACTALAWPQRPAEADASALLERSRKAALEYGSLLPDFVCTEVIQRYTDPIRRPVRPYSLDWILKDTLTVRLGYFEHKEDHKLTLINGHPTDRVYESLGGALGAGEFGGMLHSIFDPSSAATFRWVSWKNVRRRRAAVYSYVVEQAHSDYVLGSEVPGKPPAAIVGYHGELEIDLETGATLSITYQADHIPAELNWNSVVTTVDYDFAGVGGRNYLLPARSETVIRRPSMWMRNQMEFRDYGKFSTESNTTFDVKGVVK